MAGSLKGSAGSERQIRPRAGVQRFGVSDGPGASDWTIRRNVRLPSPSIGLGLWRALYHTFVGLGGGIGVTAHAMVGLKEGRGGLNGAYGWNTVIYPSPSVQPPGVGDGQSHTARCKRSTVSAAKYRSPVPTLTLAGTFSTSRSRPSTSMW